MRRVVAVPLLIAIVTAYFACASSFGTAAPRWRTVVKNGVAVIVPYSWRVDQEPIFNPLLTVSAGSRPEHNGQSTQMQ